MTTTTLTRARTAAIKLSNQLPVPSTYADHLAVISDYLDNQVPLSVENKSLIQRIAVLESAIEGLQKELPQDPASQANRVISRVAGRRRPIDCVAWMGPAAGACECPACAVRAHA